MKRITVRIFVSFFLAMIVISSCENEKEYNWKNVEPGKQKITGVDTIKGNNTPYEFLAIPRGGSTYEWKVISGPAIITLDEKIPYKAYVKGNSSLDSSALIVVTESTWGGKQGEPDTFLISKIYCYVPFNMNQIIGNGQFSSSRPGYAAFVTTLVALSGDSIIADKNFFNIGQNVEFVLSRDANETLKIVPVRFEYNTPDESFLGVATLVGYGTYSVCKRSLKINYSFVTDYSDTIERGSIVYFSF
jgi:hypothetical protein